MINIKEFGAKGDGITYDSAIFNEALSKTNHLYIPKGVYNVKVLRCYHPVTFEGSQSTVVPNNRVLKVNWVNFNVILTLV